MSITNPNHPLARLCAVMIIIKSRHNGEAQCVLGGGTIGSLPKRKKEYLRLAEQRNRDEGGAGRLRFCRNIYLMISPQHWNSRLAQEEALGSFLNNQWRVIPGQ